MKNCAPSGHGFAFLKNSLNYFFHRVLVLTLFDGIELGDLHTVLCMKNSCSAAVQEERVFAFQREQKIRDRAKEIKLTVSSKYLKTTF